SLGFLPDQAGTPSTSHHSPAPSSITPVASSSLSLPHPPACSFLPLSAGFELHIDEDGKDCGSVMPHPSLLGPHSPSSSLSAASDIDLDSVIDVSATMLSSQTKSLLVLCQSAPSNSSLSNTTTPSLTSVNTVLEHKTPKSPSPSAERLSPSVSKVFCASECIGQRPACFLDHDFDFTSPPLSKSRTPPLSTPSPLSAAWSASQSSLHFPSNPYSPSAVSPLMIPSPLIFTSTSRQLSEVSPGVQRDTPLTLQQPTAVEPSLDEALDKLLAMSFAQSHASHLEEQLEKMEAHSLDKELQEVQEEMILPMDRRCIQPDTFTSTTNTITEDSIDIGTDGNGDLDWADEELSMSLHDGLDGTMTPFTERLYTDGSMTPLTEASWMDESMTPSSCPGTPDVALDLPLLQAPSIDRVSATGHDRLIEELQGKFGITRSERRHKQSDEWLTEGVVVTSKPQRFHPEGSGSEVDKIMAQGKAGVPGGPPTQVNKLDNMLGSLQSDLNKLGVQTVAKGVCGACCKPIVGQECFTPFVNGSFFEHDGQPYCEVHYHERRGSLCSGCQKPITGRCITAMSKKFHPEHFVCAFCLKQLNKGTFKEQNDKPYCQGCFIKLFS
ncbi:hypothetical protein GOODEAATRI_026022, partial [Goodea atripinnis]